MELDFPKLVRPPSNEGVSFANQIVAHVRAMLADGRLTPGAYPPSERALAQHLGIARATVRRAYESMPELVAQQGSGWQVAR